MICLEFRTKKMNENDLSWVQDEKKMKMTCLEFKTKKKIKISCLEFKTQKNWKWVVLSSRPKKNENDSSWNQDKKNEWKWLFLSSGRKKMKMTCLEFKTKKNENELSWVQDPKKENELFWVQDQKMSENDLSWVQDEKKNENDLSWVQDQKKWKRIVLRSRPLKIREKSCDQDWKYCETLEAKMVSNKHSRQWDATNWWICVLYARVVEIYFGDFPGSVPSGILSVTDSEGVYTRTSGTRQYSVPSSADWSGTAKTSARS